MITSDDGIKIWEAYRPSQTATSFLTLLANVTEKGNWPKMKELKSLNEDHNYRRLNLTGLVIQAKCLDVSGG